MESMTREAATDRLRRVARAVSEPGEPACVDRFLERLSAEPDAEALRAALALKGAEALLREGRP